MAGIPPGRVLTMPMSQLAGYNPSVPLAILCRMSNNISLPDTWDNACNYIGVCDAAANGDTLTEVEKNTAMTLARTGVSSSWWTSLDNADTRNPGSDAFATPSLSSHVSGVHRVDSSFWLPLLGPYDTELTNPDDYTSEIVNPGDFYMPTRCSDSPSFVFAAEHWFSGLGDLDTYLMEIKIMQYYAP